MSTDEAARAVGLEEAVRRFGEAWACGNVAVLEPLLSPTYTHIDVSGRFQDRTAWLDYARSLWGAPRASVSVTCARVSWATSR